MPALIFDCDGVLADTERFGHLPAFNQMFAEFGVPVQWSESDYAELLKIGGGKERMRSILTPDFVAEAGLPTDPDEQTRAGRPLAPPQDRHLHVDGGRGRAAGSPRRPPDHRGGARGRLAACRRVDVRLRVRAGRAHPRRRGPSSPDTSHSSPAMSSLARNPHLTSTRWLSASCRSMPTTASPSKTATTGWRPRSAAGLHLRRDDEQLHPRRGLHRCGARRLESRRPGPSRVEVLADPLRRTPRSRRRPVRTCRPLMSQYPPPARKPSMSTQRPARVRRQDDRPDRRRQREGVRRPRRGRRRR